jgi:succinate dehydrogenase hydrophobic anchor subunit
VVRKIGFWLLWVGVVVYAFLFAPPNQPDTLELIQNLSTGRWEGINPLVIALFNIMGVWPMIYACLLFFDGRMQKVPAWLFSAASFAVGAFAILPYLALRQPNQEFSGSKNSWLKLLDSRWTGVVLSLAAIALVSYGVLAGDWSDYIRQFQTSRFIHVMSLDFCLLCLLFPTLLGDDMARRGIKSSQVFWVLALIPLFGPLAYLCWRPPLSD